MIKTLSETDAVSGFEDNISSILFENIDPNRYNIRKDGIGNLIVKLENKSDKELIIIVHQDEIGCIITDITNDGYLKFETIGNIEPTTLLSKSVRIGNIKGIISLKAIHLLKKDERNKKISTEELFIDIGANSKEEAKKYVTLGDLASFDTPYTELGNTKVFGKALDSRIPSSSILSVLNSINTLKYNLTIVFTVCSKAGGRGTKTFVSNIRKADAIIILDGIEYSSLEEKSKDGIVVSVTTTQNKMLKNKIQKIAENKGIQLKERVINNNTELKLVNQVIPEIPNLLIGIGIKNINTGVNIVEKRSIDNFKSVITSVIEEW